jgi:hypothetical protein
MHLCSSADKSGTLKGASFWQTAQLVLLVPSLEEVRKEEAA